MVGDNFDSPINYECQPNNVVLLTDGEPTSDMNHLSYADYYAQGGRKEPYMDDLIGACDGNCLDEIAGYMWSGDMRPDMDGDQKVITHTVGFFETEQAGVELY